ncbi:MAG: 4Fe-4S dicluster domain-containing protein [Desulfobaccales bacterium]
MMSYFKEIASGFWSLLAGMAVTIRYFVKPVVTVQYPRQKIQMSPAYRGYPRLLLDAETQTHRCIACEMCARICPSQLISVAGTKLPGAKQKVPYTYVHEYYFCSLCGLCLEVCPTTALEYSQEYRLAGFRREDAVIDHLALLRGRQQAAGLPLTPIPTAAEIAEAAAAEAAAREAREKETAAKAAQARAAKPVQTPEEAKPPKAPPEEVKE